MFFINHTDLGENSAVIIEIEGPLNSDSAPDFDDYITKLIDNNIIYLLLDMKNLKFISSEGIGAILMIQKTVAERNGIAIFFNINYEIGSLFKLLGFDKLFTITDSRADALHILDRHMELFPGKVKSDKTEHMENDIIFSHDMGHKELHEEVPNLESFEILEDDDVMFKPFIIECVKCRSLIRIKESGDQLCPYCSADFSVTEEKKAVFKVKDIH